MNNDRLKFRTPYYLPNPDGTNEFVAFAHWNATTGRPNMMVVWGNDEQCTGMRDKNGNLMYAGDRGVRNDCFVKNQEFVILWDDANARFIAKTKDGILDFIPDGDCAEIIGNIHEQKDGE